MNEVTVVGGGNDVADVLLSSGSALPENNKKCQDPAPETKEKRKGMLTGEAYSRAVDR